MSNFKKEFLPPKKLIREWEAEYWEAGKNFGRFPCSYQEYILMKSAEWGALKIRPAPRKSKGATEECRGQNDTKRHEQSTIFDFLATDA